MAPEITVLWAVIAFPSAEFCQASQRRVSPLDPQRNLAILPGCTALDVTELCWVVRRFPAEPIAVREKGKTMQTVGVGWIAAIVIGGIAGWLAEMFMKSNMGVLMNIVLGIVGAIVANIILGLLGISLSGWLGYLVAGFIGACILIAVARLIKR